MKKQTKVANDSRTKRGAVDGDINAIIHRATTGALSSSATPRFLDLTAVDYMAANNRIVDGRRAFAALPSKVRARFQNDPYQLLRFLDDESNRPEAIKLGLIRHEEPPVKRVFDMTEDEWLAMERRREDRADDRAEANPRFGS